MSDTNAEIFELKQDVEEAQALLATATRKRFKDLLSIELAKIETKLTNLQATADMCNGVRNVRVATSPTSAPTKLYTTVIRNYSWDQSDKFFKIYLSLNGVEKLDKDNIVCKFGKQSLTFQALGLNGKNEELNIANLAYPILPEKSHFKVKTDMVILFAAKAENHTWEAVTREEKKALDQKKNKKPDMGKEDPSSGLMDLMKQMYDEGDDNMKRMLNKTWYESQQKTNKEGEMPDMSGMGGMGGLGGMPGMGGLGGMPGMGGMGGMPGMGGMDL